MLLQERAMMVRLVIGAWTCRVQDQRVTEEVHQQHQAKDAGKFTKQLLEKKDLAPITRIIGEARNYHAHNSLPWLEPFRLMTVEGFESYNQKMIGFKTQFEAAIKDFVANYPKMVEASRVRLNGLFVAAEYPPEHELMDRFSFKVTYRPIPDANDFRVDLQKDDVEAIKKELIADHEELTNMAARKLWSWLREALERAHAALDKPDGRLVKTTFDRFHDLASTIKMLNITGDQALDNLARETKMLMDTIDLETVKRQPLLRKTAAKDTKALISKIDAYL